MRVAVQDVKALAWHPSGEVLVSASYDDSIRLWVDSGDEWECAQNLSGGARPGARLMRSRSQGHVQLGTSGAVALKLLSNLSLRSEQWHVHSEVAAETLLPAGQAQGSGTARRYGTPRSMPAAR